MELEVPENMDCLGMPAALGNSLSLVAGVELNRLPLLPELIWATQGGTRS